MTDLDRYYTPADIAKRVIHSVEPIGDGAWCVDPTCGSGNLLDACEARFTDTRCVGLDRDALAIRSLRRRRPHWTLSTADLLNTRSFSSSNACRYSAPVDLLALNPPFSQTKKFVEVLYRGQALRVSHAMACVLRSLEIFRPRSGAVAILPESALFSELDSSARDILSRTYVVDELFGLKSTTFRGARARTVAVRLANTARTDQTICVAPQAERLALELVRGSLPVHIARFRREGAPFVHTTDFAQLISSGIQDLRRTNVNASGQVRGWQVLLPRVGLPRLEHVRPVFLRSKVSLSDCVVALGAPNGISAKQCAECIESQWEAFLFLYRGTGARYVTMGRLRAWFALHGIRLN